jgi:phytoene synthase
VRAAGSNLAFALAVLPPEKRGDMRVFYAFCRVLDDIVDEPGPTVGQREAALDRWREIVNGTTFASPGVETEMVALRIKYDLSAELLHEIIDGMAMDLKPQTFATWEELRAYCYRAASAVGLVSIEIFGYAPGNREAICEYAEQLGYALQVTNILRDVGEDAEEGRVYLPQETLESCGIDSSAILDRSCAGSEAFLQVMEHECARAESLYARALAVLPASERKAMRSPELMRVLYSKILAKMKTDGFRVFDKRYRLSKAQMLWTFLRA